MKFSDIGSLPLGMNAEAVAEAFGCSTWSVYEGVRTGVFPVEPLHIGRKLVFPTAKVLAALGIPLDLNGSENNDPPVAQTGGSVITLHRQGESDVAVAEYKERPSGPDNPAA